VRKVYVINFIASFDQHQPLRQRLGYEVGGKQIELVAATTTTIYCPEDRPNF
jgi:hypothetical protein